MGSTIEKKLTQAGYKMFGNTENTGKLILDILKTENIRYLKAIPFLIYKQDIEIKLLNKADANIKLLFSTILTITQKIFQEFNIKKKFQNKCL